MKAKLNLKGVEPLWDILFLVPLFLYWLILFVPTPYSFTQYIHFDSLGLFLIVMALYVFALSFRGRAGALLSLTLTMVLLSLSVSYMWTSGFSDNFIMGGLVPYKDAQHYYLGSQLLLHGLPMVEAVQATERPLFPGFLTTVLWLTGGDLKIAIALIVQLIALTITFATWQIHRAFGPFAGGLFATLLFLYIQTSSGSAMSEILGVLAGCLGFSMIWLAAKNLKWMSLLLGILVLLVAVSARAGAFFLFPMLAIWVGWIFRGEKRFSFPMAVYALIAIVIGFFVVNSVYARLLGIPPGSTFGNFSYALYGQVRGGTGWHSAIEELGTRNPERVYRAAFDFFRKHPLSLFIGFAKAYRDFFLPGSQSIFSFLGSHGLSLLLWLVLWTLLVIGVVRLVREFHSNRSSLLLAGFLGIFFSIPLLPPIDGGGRFYAGTIPFFFALPAVGLSSLVKVPSREFFTENRWVAASSYSSIVLLVSILIVPPFIYRTSTAPSYKAPVCVHGQESFVIETRPGMYFDLKKHGSPCGMLPNVCASDFEKNNAEKGVDEFYEVLLRLVSEEGSGARIIPGLDLATNKFHYFYVPLDKLPTREQPAVLTGCATEIPAKNQGVFQVDSVSLAK
jgi:hypothetical protein